MERIKSYFRNSKKAQISAIIVLVTIIVAIIIVVVSLFLNREVYEIDPASGEEVLVSGPATPTNQLPENDPGILRVGFSNLYAAHTSDWIEGVISVIKLYARTEHIELSRISMVKDSFSVIDTPEISADAFSVVLNKDEERLDISVSYTIDGADVVVSSHDIELFRKEMVYDSRYIKNNGTLPSWLNTGPVISTRYSDNIPPIADDKNLPPIKNGDRIRAYFGCPLKGQTNPDGCYIYKYDFYY